MPDSARNLSHRVFVPEWMDEPSIEEDLLQRAYGSLSLVHRLSRTVAQVRAGIKRWCFAAPRPTDRPLGIADLGTGGGDLLIGIGQWARTQKIPVRLIAADQNPRSLVRARAFAAQRSLTVECLAYDAGSDPLPNADILISSLFLHHLPDEVVARLFTQVAESEISALIMNDLRRCRRGLLLAATTARLVTRNPVVHADAPQSVRAAFTPEELHGMARRAGLGEVTIRRCWPLRMQLEWFRS